MNQKQPDDSDWEKRRIKRLKKSFEFYSQNFSVIRAQFNQFNEVLREQIRSYRKFFPDASFDLPIFALPGAPFNGKAGPINSRQELGLGFGGDAIVELKNDPSVLYAHELFHIYHLKKSGSLLSILSGKEQ